MKSTRVPKALEEKYAAVTTLTDGFCGEHLSEEYGELARFAAAALARKRPSPLLRGRPRTWAVNRRHRLTSVDGLLVIGDRDQLAEAVYAAAVETGALAGVS